MCGIAGFIAPGRRDIRAAAATMADRLAHRGPDDAGVWTDEEHGVVLSHRRLAILDLSAAGAQPMVSNCGRWIIVLNGEIYNFRAVRQALDDGDGRRWRGCSDTEVLLAAIAEWGLERAVGELVGMFAFAAWDRREGVLHLVRDRIGEKPLYYGWVGSAFVFASELKAIDAFAGAQLAIDPAAIASLLQYSYIPAPLSIYRGIQKLVPASIVSVSTRPGGTPTPTEPRRYWCLGGSQDHSDEEACDDASLLAQTDTLMRSAVSGQMIADVPLGAFLSGGVDSTLIVALMQAQSSRAIRTFTIGFRERQFDEADHARAVARHLGTDHTELYVTPAEAASVIPGLPQIYDEPFADSSQIPTCLLARMTRRHVTVGLSGDGGDELFAGYPRYEIGAKLWSQIDAVPGRARRTLSEALLFFQPDTWDGILRRVAPRSIAKTLGGRRIQRFARMAQARNSGDMYVELISQWQRDDVLVDRGFGMELGNAQQDEAGSSSLNTMRRFDVEHYLPDDILVKVDRATMAVGLESRAPFLDHRVVEFAWTLPRRVLTRGGRGKWLLRELLDRYVPRSLMDRPKVGFGVPIGQWLRRELREWAEDLLDERTLRAQGYLRPEPIRAMWRQHLSGDFDRESYLWSVLMLQAWLRERDAGRIMLPACGHHSAVAAGAFA
jgi:asparagine synthase (glutamine-hydrolysing)